MEKETEQREEELDEKTLEGEPQEDEGSDGDDPYATLSEDELRNRLRKAEKAIVLNKQKPKRETSPKSTRNNQGGDDDRYAEIELKLEMKQEGYPQEAINYVLKHGGRSAFEDPIAKKVIEEYKGQSKAEQAGDIESDTKSLAFKEYSESDIENMSAEELRNVLLKAK